MPGDRLAFLLSDISEVEHAARLREMRAVVTLLCGPAHSATQALIAAIADPDAAGRALDEVDALPALTRRRVLATIGSLLPTPAR